MSFDQQLADRIRQILKGKRNIEEKKMFGGLTFMINGHMACGIARDRLMVRVVRDRYEELLKKPDVKVMDLTGKVLKGFLFIDRAGYKSESDLKFWIKEAVHFSKNQPAKKKIKKQS